MKFPLMLRKTHEEELDKAINIITEKNRIIAVKKDELEVEKRIKANLQDRNDSLHQALTIAECKLKKLEEYIEKLEQVSENKTLRNCSLNTKLIEKDAELKKLDKANKDLDDANKKLIELFNDANRKNWCNNESSRQLKRLSEEIIESDKINKTNLATYIYNISQYVGGGIPAEIKVMDDIK